MKEYICNYTAVSIEFGVETNANIKIKAKDCNDAWEKSDNKLKRKYGMINYQINKVSRKEV